MRSLDQIAQEIAQEAVATARCAGYEPLPNRAVFFRSDLMELEGEILHWLVNHMRPEGTKANSLPPAHPPPLASRASSPIVTKTLTSLMPQAPHQPG